MDADLSRKLALIMGSPLFRYQIAQEDNPEAVRQKLIDTCVKANTEDRLPDTIKTLFSACEASIAEAKRLKIPYPYDHPGDLDKILGLEQINKGGRS